MGSETFSWVIDGVLGGMSRPGMIMPVSDDLAHLRDSAGIRVVVSLTERPLDRRAVEETGLAYEHLPVADFTPPSPETLDRVVELSRRAQQTGEAVVVHCAAGMGRTGTVLAAAMVGVAGMSAEEAIQFVRQARPGSIETSEQADAVYEYEARTKNG